jgi:tRNA(fMet)-specific endonuclease VapC
LAQVIDTSVLVTMQRRNLRLSHLAAALPNPAEEIALPPFTVSELLAGIHRAPTGQNKQRMEAFLEALLDAIPVLPFGLREARAYGLLWAQLLSLGQVIGAIDALIGATALAQGYGVLTENVEHFQRIPGLVVAAPQWQ